MSAPKKRPRKKSIRRAAGAREPNPAAAAPTWGFREAGLSADPFGHASTRADVVERERVARNGERLTNVSPEPWSRYPHARSMRGGKPNRTSYRTNRLRQFVAEQSTAGRTARQIADEHGIPLSTVYRLRKPLSDPSD
jgi:hypothetical protein